jgi:hypothetical protein
MDIKLNTNHLGMDLKQNHVNINITGCKSGGSSGTTDHSKLTNLDYEHSGHIGFASAAQIQELLDLLKDKQDTLIAGDNISIVDNIISATGLTKDEIYIGPDEPTDPNIKIWIDTTEQGEPDLPDYPTDDGKYYLVVDMVDGEPTLSWSTNGGGGQIWNYPLKTNNDLKLFQATIINKINNGLEVY